MVDKIGSLAPEAPAVRHNSRSKADPLTSFGQVFADRLKGLTVASNIDPEGKVFIGNSSGLSSLNISKLV